MTHRGAGASISLRLLCVVLTFTGCGSQSAAPSSPPEPDLQVIPIESTGPIRITFLSANITPGSVVAGCGGLIEGCAGKLRITFRLDPPTDGPVLYTRAYLHATNLVACLWGETAPFSVHERASSVVEISFDRADRCGTPTTMATMAVVVEGPIQVASRQTWSLDYVFAP
jgi:hypothetical protein